MRLLSMFCAWCVYAPPTTARELEPHDIHMLLHVRPNPLRHVHDSALADYSALAHDSALVHLRPACGCVHA